MSGRRGALAARSARGSPGLSGRAACVEQLGRSQVAVATNAARLGVSVEVMRAYKAVARAESAAALGLTLDQYAELEGLADRAEAAGRGVRMADWSVATGRDSTGRKPRESRS